MKEFNLTGSKRAALGKKATREMRKQGLIPCVIYGSKKNAEGKVEATEFAVTTEAVRKLIYTPDIHVVNVDIDGQKCQAIMQELQFHPVKDNVLHIDFYEITPGQPIKIEVPVKVEGHAKGVREGGSLFTNVRKLPVKALVENVPEKLVVDVTEIEIGKSIKVGDLSYENLELLSNKDVLVCGVRATRNSRQNENRK